MSNPQVEVETSAVVRRAAGKIRADWEPEEVEPTASFHLAVADWLDNTTTRHTAKDARTTEDCRRQGCCADGCEVTYCAGCGVLVDDWPCPDTVAALAVARTYLGEQP